MAEKAASLSNFIAVSVLFSLNHGTVTALLGLASAQLGNQIGGVQSGVLYMMYSVTALTIAPCIVQRLGPKRSMIASLALFCCYVASFLVAVLVAPTSSTLANTVAIAGSVLGGCAAGWLWTAQGVYFGSVAEYRSSRYCLPLNDTTSFLAAIFTASYVGLEVVCKLAASLISSKSSPLGLYITFSAIALVSTIGMTLVADIPRDMESQPLLPQLEAAHRGILGLVRQNIVQVLGLFYKTRTLKILMPFTVSFGLLSALFNNYIDSSIVKESLGFDNIGYMTAVVPATAALLSFPYHHVALRFGKISLMVFGSVNYASIALTVLLVPQAHLQQMKWGIIVLYVISGSGRAVFESTTRALVADMYPNDKETAFAVVVVQSGVSAAVAFYTFPSISQQSMGITTSIVSLLSVVTLACSFHLQRRTE